MADLIIINSPNVINAVTKRWSFGKGVNGDKIGEYENEDYRAFKLSKNPKANGFVDLHLEGDLMAGLTLKLKNKTQIEIFSVDKKFKKIANKYGLEEFNITDEEWYNIGNDILTLAYQKLLQEMYG